jgi:hypothetical protein
MSDTPTTTPTAPAAGSAPSNRAKLERLLVACDGLMDVVEGCQGKRWSCDGTRLVDTKEWCEFYVAQRAVNSAALGAPENAGYAERYLIGADGSMRVEVPRPNAS